MRLLLLSFFLAVAIAAPQGYNYRVQIIDQSSGLTYDQLQLLQQQLEQQQQLDHQQQQQQQFSSAVSQQDNVSDLAAVLQTADNGGLDYASQLLQYQQQQSEQQQQQQQVAISKVEEPVPASQISLSQPATQLQAPAEVQYQPPTPVQFSEVAPQLPRVTVPAPAPVSTFSQHISTPTQYNKEFYYLSAPQEDNELPQSLQKQLDQIKKKLRVVFIKAPEQNGVADAALQLAKQSLESKTAIYVLNKQHDIGDLASKLQQVRGAAQRKPEVIFIKYKTPEEAEHAQRTIQAQYEALDGPNHFNHDGVAPTHNFVGSVGSTAGIDPRAHATTSTDNSSGTASAAQPNGKYLPAIAKL